MKILYEMRIQDAVAFNRFLVANKQPPSMKWINNIRVMFAYALASFFAFYMLIFQSSYWPIVLLGCTVVLDVVLHRLSVKVFVTRDLLRGSERDELGAHELEIAGDGIVEQTANANLLIKWPMINEVVLAGNRALILYGTLRAFVIPAETVSEGEFEIFVGEVRRRLAESHQAR